MNNVIRLSKETIDCLEKFRSSLIDYYKKTPDLPSDLIEYDVEKWKNASYSDLVERAAYTCLLVSK